GSQVQVIRLGCSPGRHLGTAAIPAPHNDPKKGIRDIKADMVTYMCVWCVCVCVCVCVGFSRAFDGIKIKGQIVGVSSLFPPCGL
ncbi:mCG141898, partial [Mus musculus]